MFLIQSEKNISLVLLNVQGSFEMEIVLIEQLVKQKLFPWCKLNSEEKSRGGENENASLKNDTNFILAPFINARQKWLLTTGDPKRRSIEVYSSFPISCTFEATRWLFSILFKFVFAVPLKSQQRDIPLFS